MAQAQLVAEKKKRDFLWGVFTTAFSSEIENSKFLRGALDPHLIIGDGAAHLLFELPNVERSRIWMKDAQKRLDEILRFVLGYFLPIFVRFSQRYQHEIKLTSPAGPMMISGEDICRLIQKIAGVQFPETLRREYPKFYPDMFYLVSWVDKMSGRWAPPVGFNFFAEWNLLETGTIDDGDDENTLVATSSPTSSPALSPRRSSSPIPNTPAAAQELPAKLIRSKRRMLFANRAVGKPHLSKLFPSGQQQQQPAQRTTGDTGRRDPSPPTPTPPSNSTDTDKPTPAAYDTCDCQKGNDHRH
jgi:hypothetical protein